MIPYRLLFLLCALAVYGILGAPTPDFIGLAEIAVGGLLILAVGFGGLNAVFSFKNTDPLWRSAARILLLFGFSFPVLAGALSGYRPEDILRDLIPFVFMMLPLFMSDLFEERPALFSFALYATVFVGLAFSVRVLMGSDPLLYLANMPTVLMSALLCAGTALTLFTRHITFKNMLIAALLSILAGLCLLPILITQQRAGLGAVTIASSLLLLLLFSRRPRRTLPVLAVLSAAAVMFWPQIQAVTTGFEQKTNLVGLNMRLEEWQAVWMEITKRPFFLLFGKGWGAAFHSPAVADINVRYTHSLLSSMLLKTGLLGLALTGLYLFALIRTGLRKAWMHPVPALAFLFPVLIDIFLYASFKSLDFGIVLLLMITAQAFYSEFHAQQKAGKIESPARLLYEI